MLRVKNTSTDRSKTLLHRKAAKMQMEPNVGGKRLFMGQTCDLPEEAYERNKAYYDQLIADGVIEIVGQTPGPQDPNEMPPLDADGLKLGGPTIEEWVKAGYKPENYPPQGWAIKPSPGLDKFLKEQMEAAAKKEAEEKAAAEALQKKMAEEAAAKAEAEKKAAEEAPMQNLELADMPLPTESATITTEPAGVPSAESAEEPTEQKRGPGRPKKKLF